MRLTTWILSLALMVLTGCASLPQDSGFEVQAVKPMGRQDPYQNRTINRAPFSPEGVALIYVRLPQPIPSYWKQELVDTARVYETSEAGRKVRRPLVREVFRAVVVGNGATQTYDAVVDGDDRGIRGLMVFAPLAEADQLLGQSLLILSSDGKWGMTTLGVRVEFERGFTPDQLGTVPASRITQVIRLEPKRDEYARRVLETIARAFPKPFWLRGRDEAYLGKNDVVDVLAEFTSVEGVADRLLSCTSLKLGPATAAALPLVAALYVLQAGRAFAVDDCLK